MLTLAALCSPSSSVETQCLVSKSHPKPLFISLPLLPSLLFFFSFFFISLFFCSSTAVWNPEWHFKVLSVSCDQVLCLYQKQRRILSGRGGWCEAVTKGTSWAEALHCVSVSRLSLQIKKRALSLLFRMMPWETKVLDLLRWTELLKG